MLVDLADVFGAQALAGNPLAVVRGGEGLDDAAMLAFTRWIGFSETTFLLPPTDSAADYRVRIFYPADELPFAGHPTLGSCHAWLEAGGVPRREGVVVQQCGIGLVEVRRSEGERGGGRLAFRAPPLTRSGPLSDAERAEAIRLAGVDEDAVVEAVHVANGPNWQLLRLRSAEDVLAAQPAANAPAGTDIGLAGPCAPGSETDWELRAFFADHHGALKEDPVTGSFNAGVALLLFERGLVDSGYVAGQGRCIGADGRVFVRRERTGNGGDEVWIGGDCRIIATSAALDLSGSAGC